MVVVVEVSVVLVALVVVTEVELSELLVELLSELLVKLDLELGEVLNTLVIVDDGEGASSGAAVVATLVVPA